MTERKAVKKAALKSKAAKAPIGAKATTKNGAPKTKTAKDKKTKNKPKFHRTGEKCPASGLYEHFCKDKGENSRIPLSKTETFPPCRTCGSVKWVLVMAA